MIVHFISPGQALQRNGIRYAAGARAPADLTPEQIAIYLERGLLEARDTSPIPVEAVEPEVVVTTFIHRDWHPDDPATIAEIPVRLMPQLLSSISTAAQVEVIAEAEERGKNRTTVIRLCLDRIAKLED